MLLLVAATVVSIPIITPSLSTPTLISLILSIVLSPLIINLERAGISRGKAILLLFLTVGTTFGIAGYWITQSISQEWDSLQRMGPEYFELTLAKIKEYETQLQVQLPFLDGINTAESIQRWASETSTWFLTIIPSLMGNLMTWLLIVPLFTYVLLKDGPNMRRKFFLLVPNRFFESTFIVSTKISTGLADYVQAKIVEGLLVSLLCFVGFILIGAPYSYLLALFAGITNVIPYAGPLLGAIPGVLIVVFDSRYADLLWPIVIIYSIANAIDIFLIFPLLVAKLVNLHPVILIAAVIVGQQYYGLVGMLISIPLATAMKVVLQEVYSMVYEQYKTRELPIEERLGIEEARG